MDRVVISLEIPTLVFKFLPAHIRSISIVRGADISILPELRGTPCCVCTHLHFRLLFNVLMISLHILCSFLLASSIVNVDRNKRM